MTLIIGECRCGLSMALNLLVATTAVVACDRRSADATLATAAPNPDDYRSMCGPALVAAKEFSRRLRASSAMDTAPIILAGGPPVRIRCEIRTRDGRTGTVTADVRCKDAFDRACIGPVSARLDGVVVQGPGRDPTS